MDCRRDFRIGPKVRVRDGRALSGQEELAERRERPRYNQTGGLVANADNANRGQPPGCPIPVLFDIIAVGCRA